jgi:outer membrane protein
MLFWTSLLRSVAARNLVRVAFFSILLYASRGNCQRAPTSPDHPWHSHEEQEFKNEMRLPRNSASPIEPAKTYTLPELINLAETQNPETRESWERARVQAESLGIARSELYPTLAATAVAEINRKETFSRVSFYRQTVADADGGLALSYTVLDFGARAGRISAAKADVLAANFAFNDTHRQVIYEVEQAYYSLLNAAGQIAAAEASLTNALAVQRAAEDRLKQGLATSPDALEARSAAAQAEYELQAVLGAKEISRAALARALGIVSTSLIQVQPLADLVIPDSFSNTVEQAIDRAFEQRPDLMQQLAEVRSANARIKEARAAYYPILSFNASAGPRSFYASQQSLPWEHTANWGGAAGLNLTWSLFDGGARKHKLAQAKAEALALEAKVMAARDRVADEVWTAYANFQTAFRERQAAIELLAAASQSYAAALESYNHGVRSLLDVTAAQQIFAQARSTDVLARTSVLSSVAELAFQIGTSIQTRGPLKEP